MAERRRRRGTKCLRHRLGREWGGVRHDPARGEFLVAGGSARSARWSISGSSGRTGITTRSMRRQYRYRGTMEIRPIRTDEDYQAALAEASSLMSAEAGTPEGDRLDV